MRVKETDQLAALIPTPSIAYAERMNMPYLGYHLLRETLTQDLLGESESPILYWIGKNMGRKIPIQSAQGIILPFIRLGLGQLDLIEETASFINYTLTHTIYPHMSVERLSRSLSLECGVIAGAIEQWQNRPTVVQMEMEEQGSKSIFIRACF
jgi:predicted hydrocarbon binding protein